jgi:hypothetical protein
MPKIRGEDDKKHGDKLESLIERTGGNPSPRGARDDSAEEDEPAQFSDDDDATLLQDNDDEDFQNDDGETLRDVGEPD